MSERICPWWIGYLLASPVRRMKQNPEEILGPYVKPGMKILEIGPGMGFFTLPMARMVGEHGQIVCVDVQEKMIRNLLRRARKAELSLRIVARTCSTTSLHVEELVDTMDFVLAFAVVHEVPDTKKLFQEIHSSLKKGGRLLLAEPAGHVTQDGYQRTLAIAQAIGLSVVDSPKIPRSLSSLMVKG